MPGFPLKGSQGQVYMYSFGLPIPASPGQSQREGQEDQGLFYLSLILLTFLLAIPWAPWNSLMGFTFKEIRVLRNLS